MTKDKILNSVENEKRTPKRTLSNINIKGAGRRRGTHEGKAELFLVF